MKICVTCEKPLIITETKRDEASEHRRCSTACSKVCMAFENHHKRCFYSCYKQRSLECIYYAATVAGLMPQMPDSVTGVGERFVFHYLL